MADVIAMVADVIAICLQVVIVVIIAMVADVITTCLQFDWLMLLPLWLMLLPPTSRVCLADVIAMVVDVMTTQGACVIWHMLKPYVADGITTVSIYFKFSSEMLSRTSSQCVADGGICQCFY